MRPLYAGYASWSIMKDEYAVVVTFGLSLLLINLVDKVVGPYPLPRSAAHRDRRVSRSGPVMLNGQKLIAAAISLALLVGLALFIKRSLWGRQIQAVAQNRLGASLAGIDATRTTASSSRSRACSPRSRARCSRRSSIPRRTWARSPRSSRT